MPILIGRGAHFLRKRQTSSWRIAGSVDFFPIYDLIISSCRALACFRAWRPDWEITVAGRIMLWAAQTSEPAGERVMMKRAACAAIVLCIASSASAATLRLKNYLAPADEKQRILNAVYLDGLKDGLITFNIALAHTGAAPLFCLPPELALKPDQADDILRREAGSVPEPDDMPAGIVLLAGLRKTFPCGEQSK